LTAHYRSRLNFTWKSLEAAENALNNLYTETIWCAMQDKPKIGCAEYEQRFLEAVNNDMDIPSALSIVQELVASDYPPSAKLRSLYKFDEILGLGFEKIAKENSEVPEEIRDLINKREEARKKGKFQEADRLRNIIESKVYKIEDTAQGPRLKKIV
jgi:cysteinyl-tRNA synthetase